MTPSSPSVPLIAEEPPRRHFSALCLSISFSSFSAVSPLPPPGSLPGYHKPNPLLWTSLASSAGLSLSLLFALHCSFASGLSHLLLALSLPRAWMWSLLLMLPPCPIEGPSLVGWGCQVPPGVLRGMRKIKSHEKRKAAIIRPSHSSA